MVAVSVLVMAVAVMVMAVVVGQFNTALLQEMPNKIMICFYFHSRSYYCSVVILLD